MSWPNIPKTSAIPRDIVPFPNTGGTNPTERWSCTRHETIQRRRPGCRPTFIQHPTNLVKTRHTLSSWRESKEKNQISVAVCGVLLDCRTLENVLGQVWLRPEKKPCS